MIKTASVLLLIGGVLLSIPYINTLITILTGGSGVIQTIIGILSILAGVGLLRGQQQVHGT